jgi:hypothetical protein
VLYRRRRDDLGQIVVLLVAAYGVLSVLLGLAVERAGGLGSFVAWSAGLSFAAAWIAHLVLAAGLWLQRRRALAVGSVVLVLLSLALAVLAGVLLTSSASLARAVADPRLYSGPVGWLSGCAPAMQAPVEATEEKAVEATAVVEKVVEVTRVVEVTKEVEVTRIVQPTVVVKEVAVETKVVEVEVVVTATPVADAGSATPLPMQPPVTPTQAPQPTPTAAPAEEPSRPTVQPTPWPAPPVPLLGQVAAETIYWLPEAITDPQGHLILEIPLPDVPATWRMTVLASTLNGELGEATANLVVRE